MPAPKISPAWLRKIRSGSPEALEELFRLGRQIPGKIRRPPADIPQPVPFKEGVPLYAARAPKSDYSLMRRVGNPGRNPYARKQRPPGGKNEDIIRQPPYDGDPTGRAGKHYPYGVKPEPPERPPMTQRGKPMIPPGEVDKVTDKEVFRAARNKRGKKRKGGLMKPFSRFMKKKGHIVKGAALGAGGLGLGIAASYLLNRDDEPQGRPWPPKIKIPGNW